MVIGNLANLQAIKAKLLISNCKHMPIGNLFKISLNDRNKFCSIIIDSSAPKTDFYFLVILSSMIVSLGLLADNVILVIGGMLVTPILSPILAIALGIVINDAKVIKRSVRIFLISFILAFLVALTVGFFSSNKIGGVSLLNIMQPSLYTLVISIVAGLAASYTWVKPNLNETLPGIAITVTLIPPLTAIGLAVSEGNWFVFGMVLKVLLINLFGIIASSSLIFSLMDFYKVRCKVVQEVKLEEKAIEREKEKQFKNQ